MTTISAGVDRELMLTLIEESHSATSAQMLRQIVVYGLSVLFESISCAWTELKVDLFDKEIAKTTVAHSNDDSIDLQRLLPVFNQYISQHPAISLIVETGHAPALSISELRTRTDFTSLELYQQFYSVCSVEDQLSVGYVEDEYVKGVSINRATWGFSDDERDALTQISRCIFPHYRLLQQSEQNAANRLPLIEVTVNAIVRHHEVLGLTQREAELLGEVANGKSNKQIAAICDISEGTVRKHLENTFRRLGVNNRVSAVTHSMQMIQQAIGN